MPRMKIFVDREVTLEWFSEHDPTRDLKTISLRKLSTIFFFKATKYIKLIMQNIHEFIKHE